MSKGSDAVIRWRKRTKRKMIEAMGGECQLCGYSKCDASLDFHHINPTEKDFSFGKMRANPKAINAIMTELRKCILLCANCHREVHEGSTELPEDFAKLDDSKLLGEIELKRKIKAQKCVTRLPLDRRKIKLTKDELEELLHSEFNGNKSALARSLNVTETAIRKQLLAL